ncbi:hypothetical protein FWN93_04150 [Salmonella enterica]|uniref:Uncharacterized protein n=1 Tax=Salmonella enterica TaxID=28901 RepID=A0A5U8AWN4_SALER|nr:hypothetical protein [Salmonella enterica]EDD6037169.1 hypothetical protein [Salmonella enterica subsp. enterica serovar Panama]EBA3087846.1 hypothetical protein [Salmonella enterica]EBR6701488.1 hypothetical protein [Salmonella enterica]EBU5510065.1 hypothetical protein [Salmonella enterica]
MFLLDNNIFASGHGVAFQTGFYKTRAIRFFMDSYGYIFRFKMRLFNTKVYAGPIFISWMRFINMSGNCGLQCKASCRSCTALLYWRWGQHYQVQ